MASNKLKASAKKSIAVLSSLAILLSCGTTGLFSASAAQTDESKAVAANDGTQAAKKIKIYSEGKELNTIVDPQNPTSTTPILYLDNSYVADGEWYKTIDVKIEGGSGDEIKYQVEPQPSSKHIAVYEYESNTSDSLSLEVAAAEVNGTTLTRYAPGTTHIYFTTSKGEIYTTLTIVVYSPAEDMNVFWGNKNTKIELGDENLNNDFDVVAVANHQYQLFTTFNPSNSTDDVEYAVYDGDFIYENAFDYDDAAYDYDKTTKTTTKVKVPKYSNNKGYSGTITDEPNQIAKGYVPQPTTKAEITSNGFFTAKEQGTVTIVIKPKATETSTREYAVGSKKRYQLVKNTVTDTIDLGNGQKETVKIPNVISRDTLGNPVYTTLTTPYMQTLPKYIHVTIAKENPAASMKITNSDRASALQLNEKLQLNLEATPSYTGADYQTGATDVFKWVSSNDKVVTVDEKGLVTAVGKGNAKVTVYGEKENVRAECNITVYTAAEAITFDKTEGNVRTARIDVPIELTANLTPTDSNEKIIWETEDESIATVEPISTGELTSTQKAILTGHKVGKTNVIAKTVEIRDDGTLSDKIVTKLLVDVKEKNISGNISVTRVDGNEISTVAEDSTQYVYTKHQLTFKSSLTSADGETQADDVTEWEILDNDQSNLKVQVDKQNGEELVIHGVAEGKVKVIAHAKTTPDLKQTFEVEVLKSADNINLYNTEAVAITSEKPLNIGKTFTIIPVLTANGNVPTDHADTVKSWTSSNPDVATVDENGNVVGVSIGKTTITCTSASGLQKTAIVNVFIPSSVMIQNYNIQPAASSEEVPKLIIPFNSNLTGSAKLNCTVLDSYGTTVNSTVDVEWTSSNEEVATVDNKGNVTAHAVGNTYITAQSGNTDKKDILFVTVTAPINSAVYNDLVQMVYSPLIQSYEPKTDVYFNDQLLTEGVDYTVSYQNNTGVGTATCTVTGIGDYYTGSKILTFQIVKRDLSDPSVHVSDIPDYQANGSPIVPDLKITCENVELTKGTDYSVELTNNTMPGEAMLKIIGIGSNYSGTITKTFSIYCNHEELQDTTVVKKPTFKEDGTLRGKCTQCGMTVEKAIPKTNYRDINDANVTVQTSFAYSPAKGGVQPKPVLTVDGTTTLEEGVDYTLSYNENDKITSSAEIVITGIKGYGESKSVKFSITSRALSSDGVTVADIKKQAYDKDVPSTPSVTVKCDGVTLKEDTDYKLSYSNNNKIGKATVTINGMGNYSGSITKEFEIFNNSHGIVGDVDGDESLTSADALSILRYSVDLEKFDNTQLGLADVNNDNSVDSADSLSVLRYSVGLIDNSTIGKEK